MAGLEQRSCAPCRGGIEPIKGERIDEYTALLDRQWTVVDEHHLHREYRFTNFREALDFVNQVGELAESQGHHPDIQLGYGMARIMLWTHKIDGLHENDFILAAKIDHL
jgi:4a-hydroxytetrahydrobiopterin dehydratase